MSGVDGSGGSWAGGRRSIRGAFVQGGELARRLWELPARGGVRAWEDEAVTKKQQPEGATDGWRAL
jgi:hypothetical protein